MAKKAVDSTLRRILNYTAEIIMSMILLIIICIPLIFTIPMWFQHVLFDVPRTELSINPMIWFGLDGALLITLSLGLVSFVISYIYILKMKPGITSTDDVDSEDLDEEMDDEDIEDISDEELANEEDIPLEDQEDEPDLDEIEEEVTSSDEDEDDE